MAGACNFFSVNRYFNTYDVIVFTSATVLRAWWDWPLTRLTAMTLLVGTSNP